MIPNFIKQPNLRLLCSLMALSCPPFAYVGWHIGQANAVAAQIATIPTMTQEKAGPEITKADMNRMRMFMHPAKRQSFRLNRSILDAYCSCLPGFSCADASVCVSKRVPSVPHMLRQRSWRALAGQA